jgi:hypothetical protein
MRLTMLVPLLLLAACGAPTADPPAVAPAPGPHTSAAEALASLPEEVGGLRLVSMRRYPDPRAGVHRSYGTDDGLVVDVYVYPIGESMMREPTGARAEAEAEFFKQSLDLMRRNGAFDDFRITGEGPVAIAGDAWASEGWLTSARLQRRGEERDTHQHLVEVGDHFVKFRSTFAAGRGRDAEVLRFIQALLATRPPG